MTARKARKGRLLAGPLRSQIKMLVLLVSKRGLFCHRGLEEMNVSGPKACVGTVGEKEGERWVVREVM